MKLREGCLFYLYKGYGLRNIHGGTVIKVFGKQYAVRLGKKRRGKAFSFSNPKYWHIVELSFWEKLKIMFNNEVRG